MTGEGYPPSNTHQMSLETDSVMLCHIFQNVSLHVWLNNIGEPICTPYFENLSSVNSYFAFFSPKHDAYRSENRTIQASHPFLVLIWHTPYLLYVQEIHYGMQSGLACRTLSQLSALMHPQCISFHFKRQKLNPNILYDRFNRNTVLLA